MQFAFLSDTTSCMFSYFSTVLFAGTPPAAMVKDDFVVGAFCEKRGRDGELISLIRPCVDCGLLTGNWCEANCFAVNWLGSKLEDWQDSQITPHCTHCEKSNRFCHFCLGKDWATPDTYRIVDVPLLGKVCVPLEDTDIDHVDDGVIVDMPYSAMLARNDSPPTRLVNYANAVCPSSPTSNHSSSPTSASRS